MNLSLNPISIAAGIAGALALEVAKRWDSVPLKPDDTAKIQKILQAGALLIAIGQALLNKSLTTGIDWTVAVTVLWDAFQVVGTAVVTYHAGLKKANKPPAPAIVAP